MRSTGLSKLCSRLAPMLLLGTVAAMGAVPPVVPNASPEAQAVLSYIYTMRNQKMISGQMESTWMTGGAEYEMNYILGKTGKLPAIRGLDFMDFNGVATRSIAWWAKGGIPTICWHWGAPSVGTGYEGSKMKVDIAQVLLPGTVPNKKFMADLDQAAAELAKLRDAKVPVLWRPFHEIGGNWFWWSMGGAEQFKQLWKFQFDYFTNTKKLNNLIWVLAYSGDVLTGWDPGKQYWDITGADGYPSNNGPALASFQKVQKVEGTTVPIAYHECGYIPDPDQAKAQGANWSFFMTWHSTWLTANTDANLTKVFNHDWVITLDELPNFKAMATSIEARSIPGNLSVARGPDGWKVGCGQAGCGQLSLISMDGRKTVLNADETAFVPAGRFKAGVYLLHSTTAGDRKILLDR